MPQINLLYPGMKTVKKQERIFSVGSMEAEFKNVLKNLILYASVSLAIALIVWAVFAVNVSQKRAQLTKIANEVKNLEVKPKEIEELKSEKAALEKKIKLIDDLSSRKFYYYEKLNLLTQLIPDGVWITQISSKKMSSSAIPSRSRRMRRVQTTTEASEAGEGVSFTINGKSIADRIEEEVELIDNFIENLKNSEEFSKDFVEIKLNNIAKSTVGGRDIMTFDLICDTD